MARRLKDINIFSRILSGFILIFLIMLLLGGFSIYEMHRLSTVAQEMYEQPFTTVNVLLDARNTLQSSIGVVRNMIMEKDSAKWPKMREQMDERDRKIKEYLQIALNSYSGDKRDIQGIIELFEKWKAYREDTIRLVENRESDKAWTRTVGTEKNPGKDLTDELNRIVNKSRDFAADFYKSSRENYQSTIIRLAFSFIVLSILIILVAISITRPIVSNFTALNSSIKDVAGGSLDTHIPCTELKNEFGEMANAFETLKQVLIWEGNVKSYMKNEADI